MLNREMIIEKANAQYGWNLDAWNDDVIEKFIDLDILGIDDDAMLKAIESGTLESEDDLFDGSKILQSKPKKKAKKTKKPASTPKDNPFGMFESAITQVVEQQAEPIIDEVVNARLNAWVNENSNKITKKIEYIAPSGKKMDDITHEEFEKVETILQGNEPVLLVGPAGTGKNHLGQQIAEHLDLDFYYTSSVTMEHKMMGFIDANGVYHETPFFKASTLGGVLFIDELDNSDPEVLKTTVNAAFDNGYVDFPTGKVKVHENFRVIAAANTFGTGASYEYVGANQLDASTLDRFMPVYIDYSERIENALTDDEGLLEFIRTFRSACVEYGIHHVASYRAIRRCTKFVDALGVVDTLKGGLLKNLERDDMSMMVNKFSGMADKWSLAFVDIAEGRC